LVVVSELSRVVRVGGGFLSVLRDPRETVAWIEGVVAFESFVFFPRCRVLPRLCVLFACWCGFPGRVLGTGGAGAAGACTLSFFLCDGLAAYEKRYIRPGTTLGTSPTSVWR
jgi:hypothetical protein